MLPKIFMIWVADCHTHHNTITHQTEVGTVGSYTYPKEGWAFSTSSKRRVPRVLPRRRRPGSSAVSPINLSTDFCNWYSDMSKRMGFSWPKRQAVKRFVGPAERPFRPHLCPNSCARSQKRHHPAYLKAMLLRRKKYGRSYKQ